MDQGTSEGPETLAQDRLTRKIQFYLLHFCSDVICKVIKKKRSKINRTKMDQADLDFPCQDFSVCGLGFVVPLSVCWKVIFRVCVLGVQYSFLRHQWECWVPQKTVAIRRAPVFVASDKMTRAKNSWPNKISAKLLYFMPLLCLFLPFVSPSPPFPSTELMFWVMERKTFLDFCGFLVFVLWHIFCISFPSKYIRSRAAEGGQQSCDGMAEVKRPREKRRLFGAEKGRVILVGSFLIVFLCFPSPHSLFDCARPWP